MLVPKEPCDTLCEADGDFEVKCVKCQYPIDAEDVSARKVGKQGPTCKSCHNVQTMLTKQLDHMPMEWDMMKPAEHVKFLQQCAQLKDDHGTLKYKHVRATLAPDTADQRSFQSQTWRRGRISSTAALDQYWSLQAGCGGES